jgi:hypothetical protein
MYRGGEYGGRGHKVHAIKVHMLGRAQYVHSSGAYVGGGYYAHGRGVHGAGHRKRLSSLERSRLSTACTVNLKTGTMCI